MLAHLKILHSWQMMASLTAKQHVDCDWGATLIVIVTTGCWLLPPSSWCQLTINFCQNSLKTVLFVKHPAPHQILPRDYLVFVH